MGVVVRCLMEWLPRPSHLEHLSCNIEIDTKLIYPMRYLYSLYLVDLLAYHSSVEEDFQFDAQHPVQH